MGQPATKQGDQIVAIDTHIVMVPAGPSQVPTPLPHPFAGIIGDGLSQDVKIMGLPAATVGSTADNMPPHIPMPPGTAFQKSPSNKATIQIGSPTVMINGKQAARNGDPAMTCNDPVDSPAGKVVAAGTVFIG
ncbi:MAG: hypothetical protein V7641_3578 [Blastocatellia bacterium]